MFMPSAVAPTRLDANVAVYRLNVDEPAPNSASHAVDERDWIEPLLHQNAIWFCQLRWIVVAVLGSGRAFSLLCRANWPWPGCGSNRPVLLAAGAVLGALQPGVYPLGTAGLSPDSQGGPVRMSALDPDLSDLLVLTAVIYWLGAGIAPAPFMYLFPYYSGLHRVHPGRKLGRRWIGGAVLFDVAGHDRLRARMGIPCW